MSAGFLMGDAETGCVWGADELGARYTIALPPGWTAWADPVAVVDSDGEVAVREGEHLEGARAEFPWWRSGPVLCEVEGAVETVRFSEITTPAAHLDDARDG